MSQQLDPIDTIATKAFEGYVVRKDLVRKFKGQYPVPTYVGEFLLGRYCASVDDEEIAEGLKIVERQLGERTVRAGEEELFKARAKEKGHVKLIDIITARLDAGTDSLLRHAAEPAAEGRAHRRRAGPRATSGCSPAASTPRSSWTTTPTIAQEKNGRPFGIDVAARRSSSPSATCCDALSRAARRSPPRSGRTSCCAASAWSRSSSRRAPAT